MYSSHSLSLFNFVQDSDEISGDFTVINHHMSPPLPPPQSLTKPHQNSFSNFIFSTFSLFLNSNPNPNFFKPQIMQSPTIKTHNKFATPQSLSDWLRPRLNSDSFAAWGTRPGTKNIHNLWLELTEGETSLLDTNPPVRNVEVVVVRVRDHKDRILIESHQELSNGDVRNRSRPLSEKMKPGESVEQAVIRAVNEELGSIIRQNVENKEIVRIIPNSYSCKVEERVSVSYPGLPACYVLHTVDVFVNDLPDCEFCTEEGDEYENLGENENKNERAISCKKHFWKWVDSNTI